MRLLINERNQWKEQLIRQSFIPIDAEEIINIHLLSMAAEDKLLWNFDVSCKFSVKSCYQVAIKANNSSMANCSTGNGECWGLV